MDDAPRTADATVGRATRDDAVWQQWVVPAALDDVHGSLSDPATASATGLVLDAPSVTSGTLTPGSRRWRGRWRRGRHHGPAVIELTRLSPASTLVELCLGAASGPFAPAGARRHRHRVAAGLARVLDVEPPARPRPAEPAVVRLTAPRGAGRLPVAAGLALVLLALAPTAWALLAGQGPTAVTEEQALAEHRARVRQLADERASRSAPTGDQEAPDADAAQPAPERDGAGADGSTADAATATPAADDPATTGEEAGDPAAEEEDAPPTSGDSPPADDAETEHPDAPEEGVYRYATDGGEAVGVPGGSRDYPRRTTISVTESGCGHVARWSVLEERWDERETCAEDGALAALTSYREFFGHAERHEFVCDEQRPDEAASLKPGRSWAITCEADDARLEGTVEVVGREEVEVRGTTVPTVRLRLDGELSGELTGTQETERWVSPPLGGLVIRETSRTRARVDSPMGEVDYREDYRIEVQHLRPRR